MATAAEIVALAVPVPVVTEMEVKNTEMQKKNRIQVSNTKKPLFFYVNLAKRYMQQHNEVELSALGMGCPPKPEAVIDAITKLRKKYLKKSTKIELAITTVVTIAEILKNNGLATEKKVLTSTVGTKDESKGRLIQKARIEIVLERTEKFESLVAPPTAAPEAAAENKDEKQTAAA